MNFLGALFSFIIISFFHDFVGKYLYCFIKKKLNRIGKCYFWTCKNWHICLTIPMKRGIGVKPLCSASDRLLLDLGLIFSHRSTKSGFLGFVPIC